MAKKAHYPEELHEQLRSPSVGSSFWTVKNQEDEAAIPYDPDKIAPALQRTILAFASDPPRTDSGHRKWLCVLASRQTGKSTTTALAVANKVAHTPGMYGAIMADVKERAEDLFMAINFNQKEMDEEFKVPTIPNRESRQITYYHGGKIRTLTEGTENVGIGRAVGALQWSEVPFCKTPGTTWNGLYPALANRKEGLVMLESTPAQMTQPGAEFYRDTCAEARKGVSIAGHEGDAKYQSRWLFHFSAFFESRLNERPWGKDWKLDKIEQEMLNTYGPGGPGVGGKWGGQPISNPGDVRYLTLENLSFRRETLRMDRQVRRNPNLFKVFYPVNPVDCWLRQGGAAIPAHVLAKVEDRSPTFVPWTAGHAYMEFRKPVSGAVYVLCADPAGWMGGDQASFHVLEVWADRVYQAATFSSNLHDPHSVSEEIIRAAHRYNNAYTIVENTGVGGATIALLEAAHKALRLKNLHYERIGNLDKPGVPAQGRLDKALAALLDTMIEKLVIHDMETWDQLNTYRRDKKVQDGETKGILRPGQVTPLKRAKHHWDRISALMWGCYAIMEGCIPLRFRVTEEVRDKFLPDDADNIDNLTRDERIAVMDELTAHMRKAERERKARARKELRDIGQKPNKTRKSRSGRRGRRRKRGIRATRPD